MNEMISVRCKRGAGVKEAPAVVDPLIGSERVAVLRGTKELDDLYYSRSVYRLECRWLPVMDGDVIQIEGPILGEEEKISKLLVVNSVTFRITGDELTASIDAEGDHVHTS